MEVVKGGVDLFFSERFQVYRNTAAVIGSLVAVRLSLRTLYRVWKWLRAYFLAPLGMGRTNLMNYGSWAVVTGASEGIGRGYALELARQGLNVVLMSRSQTKLDKVAGEIRERYSREVRVVPVDFSHGAEIYPQLAESVQDLDIGILVNNVGFSVEYPDYFLDMSIERQRKIIEINIQATVHMTHCIMPKMVAKKRGVVINLSSGSGISPVFSVLLSVYGATKAFVEFFTTSLSLEYANQGIIVQTVCPFVVSTPMTDIYVKKNWFVPDGEQYARSAVATIGVLNYTHGCLLHAVQGVISRIMPGFFAASVTRHAMISSRDAYLKKKSS